MLSFSVNWNPLAISVIKHFYSITIPHNYMLVTILTDIALRVTTSDLR